MTNHLSFKELRSANVARLPAPKFAECEKWSLSDWMLAATGELGELANLIKKVNRGDFTLQSKSVDIADEIADVVIYLDILAHKAGINLGEAVTRKFNAVSERVNSSVRLPESVSTMPEFTPIKVRIDGYSGTLSEYKDDHAMSAHCRVLTLLAAVEPATPVGMHQPEPKTAQAQPAEATRPESNDASAPKCQVFFCHGLEDGWYRIHAPNGKTFSDTQWNEAKLFALNDNPHYTFEWSVENPGRFDHYIPDELRTTKAKGFVYRCVQVLNDNSVSVDKPAPEPDAHKKADKMLAGLRPETARKFNFNDGESSPAYPGGLTAGSKVQVITTTGNILNGNVGDFHWSHSPIGPVVVYWRRIE